MCYDSKVLLCIYNAEVLSSFAFRYFIEMAQHNLLAMFKMSNDRIGNPDHVDKENRIGEPVHNDSNSRIGKSTELVCWAGNPIHMIRPGKPVDQMGKQEAQEGQYRSTAIRQK